MGKQGTGNTRLLHLRVSPELYESFARVARQQNMTVSELVRRQMRAVVARPVELVLEEQVA